MQTHLKHRFGVQEKKIKKHYQRPTRHFSIAASREGSLWSLEEKKDVEKGENERQKKSVS